MPYTWIKTYVEILDDPKMGRLPDHLWRRTIELFLLAGRLGSDGLLPSIDEMAWTMRATVAELTADLDQIEAAGIITRMGDQLIVKNFTKRQAAMTATERTHKFRAGETKKFQERNEVVTEEEEEEEVEEEEKKNREEAEETQPKAKTPAPAAAYTVYESNKLKGEWNQNAGEGQAHSILLNASLLAAVPMNERARIDTVLAMVAAYGKDKTTKALTDARIAWVKTPRKNGGTYSVTNFGWVDWAQEQLASGHKAWERGGAKPAKVEMRGEAVNAEVAKWLGRR